MFLFFFSRRRRHTRSLRDWSSDVCSSDLFGRAIEKDTRADRQAGQAPQAASGEKQNCVIGTSLNQYRITSSIGAGGMGEVFRARDTRLNRDVAVKVLPKDFVADADRLRR